MTDVSGALSGFVHTRSYNNKLKDTMGNWATYAGPNGNNWVMPDCPYLVEDDAAIVFVKGDTQVWFDLDASTWTARYGADDRYGLSQDAVAKTYTLTVTAGGGVETYVFHDFTVTLTPKGFMKEYTDAYGKVTSVHAYNGESIEEVRRTEDTTLWSLRYTFYPAGSHTDRIQYALLRKSTDGGSNWTDIRRAEYAYHSGMTAYGSQNDLETVTTQWTDGSTWSDASKTYYRFYKSGDTNGFEGGLKYVVGPAAYAEMLADLLMPESATDGQVSGYADHYFEYDSTTRAVTKEVATNCAGCGGGSGTGSAGEAFTRTESAHADAYNNWKWKVVFTKANGNVETVYTNYLGQLMLKDLKESASSDRNWVTYTKYGTTGGATGKAIEVASPAAVTGYDDTNADLGVSLKTSAGLITYTTYGDSTTASGETLGDALGYVKEVSISEGDGGGSPTKIKQRAMQYKTSGTAADSIVVGKQTVYTDEAGTDAIETTHAYQWYTGGTIPGGGMKERTTTLPTISTAQHGTGETVTTKSYYDDRGRMTFGQDERDIITQNTYDQATGLMTKTRVDVDAGPAGEGWTVVSGPHEDVTTDYAYDDLGRQVQMLGQEHTANPTPGSSASSVIRHATWMVYIEGVSSDQTWTGRGYSTAGGDTLIDPVSITFSDKNGNTVDQIQSKRSTGSGKLTSSDTFLRADWSRWSTMIYSTTGLLDYERTYHTVPSQSPDEGLAGVTSDPGFQGNNFEETYYGYDTDTNLRVRTLTPGGTITRTVYDAINRVSSTWVGTQDDTTPLPAADAQWELTETTTTAAEALDSTGNGNTATPQNFASISFVTGPSGDPDSALVFDGISDYLSAPHILDPAAGSFSAACWVRPTAYSASNNKVVLQQSDGGGTGRSWLRVTPAGRLETFLGGTSTLTTASLALDAWHHIALTFDGTNLRLFINGQVDRSAVRTMEACTSGTMLIGIDKNLTTGFCFDGAMADVTIWPTALTDAQVEDLARGRAAVTDWRDWGPDLPGTNMKKLVEHVYDDGAAGGNSNLTRVKQFADDNTTRDTAYAYDFRNRQTAVTDATGRVSVPTYDNLSRVTQTDQYDGGPDATGVLIGRQTSAYDDLGRVYETKQFAVNPDTGAVGNALTGQSYHDNGGNVVESIAPGAGAVFTKTDYDNLSRPTRSYTGYEASGGGSGDVVVADQETAYNKIGQVLSTTTKLRDTDTPAGAPTFRETYAAVYYDGLGRSIASADYGTNGGSAWARPDAIPASTDLILVSTTAYNDAGEAETFTDPQGTASKTEYDDMGRVTRQIDNVQTSGSGPDINRTTETTYTADSLQETITAKMTDPADDEVTTYIYGVTTANGSGLNANNLLTAIQYPTDTPASRISLKVNRLGELVERADQNGTVHAYGYDLLGRPITDAVTSFGPDIDDTVRRLTTTYSSRGQVLTLTSHSAISGMGDEVNQVRMAYNDFGQLVTDYQAHAGTVDTANSLKVEYGYAPGSDGSSETNQVRPTGITYPSGRRLEYNYGANGSGTDLFNRVHAVRDGSTNLVQYKYLGGGRIVVADYTEPDLKLDLWGDTPGTYNGLDNFGRVVDQRWVGYAGSPVDAARLQYGYDRDGMPSYRKDTVAHALGAGFDELYGRDGLRRLNDYQRGQLNGTNDAISGGTLTFSQDWSLDQVANQTALNQDSSGGGTDDLVQTRSHNRVNEITAITNTSGGAWSTPTYDAAGNTTRTPYPNNPTSAAEDVLLTYDAWNRVVRLTDAASPAATRNAYTYDARGFRIGNTLLSGGQLDHYYTAGWQCIEDRSNGALESQYVWGLRYIDDLVQRQR
ncbi:MAG: LamG-like jellyroll fold domain-containing protein, partial [Planctomycetota bacterium]